MKVAVTGATGFVGTALVGALQQEGHQVRRLVRRYPAGRSSDLAESVVGSLSDAEALRRLCDGADALVHLVAIIRERGAATFESVNVAGVQQVVAAARTAGVRRFVHLSALGADAASRYPYLRSKGLGEDAVRVSGLNYTILRPSIIFGPSDEFVNLLAALVVALPAVPIAGSGGSMLQPISLRNLCQIVIGCLESDQHSFKSYEIGGPEQISYESLVRTIAGELGLRRLLVKIPLWTMIPVASLMGRLLPYPPVTPGQLSLLNIDNITTNNAALEVFHLDLDRLAGNIGYIHSLTWPKAMAAVLGLAPVR